MTDQETRWKIAINDQDIKIDTRIMETDDKQELAYRMTLMSGTLRMLATDWNIMAVALQNGEDPVESLRGAKLIDESDDE